MIRPDSRCSSVTVVPSGSGDVVFRGRMGMTRIHCVSAEASR